MKSQHNYSPISSANLASTLAWIFILGTLSTLLTVAHCSAISHTQHNDKNLLLAQAVMTNTASADNGHKAASSQDGATVDLVSSMTDSTRRHLKFRHRNVRRILRRHHSRGWRVFKSDYDNNFGLPSYFRWVEMCLSFYLLLLFLAKKIILKLCVLVWAYFWARKKFRCATLLLFCAIFMQWRVQKKRWYGKLFFFCFFGALALPLDMRHW